MPSKVYEITGTSTAATQTFVNRRGWKSRTIAHKKYTIKLIIYVRMTCVRYMYRYTHSAMTTIQKRTYEMHIKYDQRT